MDVPEDVMEFLRELERRKVDFKLVAVERTPAPDETFDVWVRKAKEGAAEYEYVGVRPASEVYKERDWVACGKLTCVLFRGDVMDLAFSRETRRVHEPVEV